MHDPPQTIPRNGRNDPDVQTSRPSSYFSCRAAAIALRTCLKSFIFAVHTYILFHSVRLLLHRPFPPDVEPPATRKEKSGYLRN